MTDSTDSKVGLKLGQRTFTSRLLVGTGKYPSAAIAREALLASGAEIVTVAVRRVNHDAPQHRRLLDRRRGRAHRDARARSRHG
jgi:thiazole synthase ThiGH ThiG subunit